MQPFFLYRDDESTPQRVSRFPDPPRPITTINLHTSGWTGTIEIHASIALEPTDDDWVMIHRETIAGEQGKRQNFLRNLTGCFIWLKAVVVQEGTRGRVDRVTAI